MDCSVAFQPELAPRRPPVADSVTDGRSKTKLVRVTTALLHHLCASVHDDAEALAALLMGDGELAGGARPPRKQMARQPWVLAVAKAVRLSIARGAPPGEVAQVASLLTTEFTLDEVKALVKLPLSPRQWRYARWHAAAWGVGCSAPVEKSRRLRFDAAKLRAVVKFLQSPANLHKLAHGERVVAVDGEEITLPAGLRDQCREQLWRDWRDEHSDARGCYNGGIGRSAFLELSAKIAKGDLKSLAALDPVSVVHGSEAVKALCDYIDELGLAPANAEVAKGAALAIKAHITNLQAHLGDEPTSHIDSHCIACAVADPLSKDPTRPRPCGREHTHRCADCDKLFVLEQALLDVVATKKTAALTPFAAAVADAAAAATTTPNLATAASPAVAAAKEWVAWAEAAKESKPPPSRSQAPAEVALRNAVELEVLLFGAHGCFASLKHWYAHELRAAHEAKVSERILEKLGQSGVMITLDWKMKFLPFFFREAQSDFFGKAGIPWQGVMLVFSADGVADAGALVEGEFLCEFVDQVMTGRKEDGAASFQGLQVS